jgi:YHS domain-containing protein
MFTKKKMKDPVCGMEIKVNRSAARIEFNGIEYYFCSDDCFKKFEMGPEKYVEPPKAECCDGNESDSCEKNHGEHQHLRHCTNKHQYHHKCHS